MSNQILEISGKNTFLPGQDFSKEALSVRRTDTNFSGNSFLDIKKEVVKY